MDANRQLFIMAPDSSDDAVAVEHLRSVLRSFEPNILSATLLRTNRQVDGNLLLVPSGSWPPGVLSDLTRIANLSLIALVGEREDPARVSLWYGLGASLVLDANVSSEVLRGVVEKFLEKEVQIHLPNLTRKENMIFESLRQAGRAGLGRSALVQRVWDGAAIHEKAIDVHIFNLRRKLNSTRFRVICEARRFVLRESSE